MKIVTILGARPQFIKAAMISKVISTHSNINETTIHTGQHFDTNMSQIFFDEMGIPAPNYNLGINRLNHGAMTGRMLEELEKIYIDEKPDQVIVYGDTNSTLAGALAATKIQIPVAHVEAGLRSFNKEMPEEINRILTDHIAYFLFTPSKVAKKNLLYEGIMQSKIFNVGDVMYDASLTFGKVADEKSTILDDLNLNKDNYIICTIHRQENLRDIKTLITIVSVLNRISKDYELILPVHPNTRKALDNLNEEISFTLIDPIGYLDMLKILKNCKLVMTDSGGLQKEAYFNNKICLTLRKETEWVELVKSGYNFLVLRESDNIYNIFEENICRTIDFNTGLYGDGTTACKIMNILLKQDNLNSIENYIAASVEVSRRKNI